MRLWLSKSSEVPLREQLVAQIMLGIVSGDLKAGQKLPSTRELGRRFRVHANTVSAAYRDLHRRGWGGLRATELMTLTDAVDCSGRNLAISSSQL